MNKLYIGITLLGFLNIVILMTNLVLIFEFKVFKDISDAWNEIATGQSKIYHLIIEHYKNMAARYDAQKALFDKTCMYFDALNGQYKIISEKLDMIFPPHVSVSPEDFKVDNEDIVI